MAAVSYSELTVARAVNKEWGGEVAILACIQSLVLLRV